MIDGKVLLKYVTVQLAEVFLLLIARGKGVGAKVVEIDFKNGNGDLRLATTFRIE